MTDNIISVPTIAVKLRIGNGCSSPVVRCGNRDFLILDPSSPTRAVELSRIRGFHAVSAISESEQEAAAVADRHPAILLEVA